MVFGVCTLFAAPRNGEIYEFEQPDGTLVELKLFGDDYYLRAESLDGYTLIREVKTGWICYAKLNDEKDQLISTGIHYTGENDGSPSKQRTSGIIEKHLDLPKTQIEAQREISRGFLGSHDHSSDVLKKENVNTSQNATATNHVIGEYKGISILVDFSDAPAVWDKATIDQMLNGEEFKVDGNYSSVKKYFSDVSGGLVEYENVLFGYYRAPKSFATYDNMSYASGAREILQFVLSEIENEGFDFSSLSIKNGNIQAINLMYTGSPKAWAKGMWYHKGTYTGFSADGVSTRDYNTSPVNSGLSIGTIIHENGHMLCGWPDLYKYSSDTGTSGIGDFCIMSGYGSTRNPIPPNPYFRWLAGWTSTFNISNHNGTVTETVNDKTVYKYDHPINTDEFFIMEAVQKMDRGAYYPDEGLVIWHIDRTGNNQTWEHEVWLEHANNTRDDHKGACWHSGGNTNFNDNTFPNANWLDGSNSELELSQVSGVGSTMTFKAVGNGAQCTNNEVTDIILALDSITVYKNKTLQFFAEPKNECGETVSVPVVWSDNAPEGKYTAVDFGRFIITATVGDIVGQVIINVVEDPNNCSDSSVVSLELTPASTTVFIGEQINFSVKGINKCGGEEAIDPNWSDNALNGVFTASQVGEHNVSVSYNSIIINRVISVLPENATLISNSEIANLSFMNTEWYAHDDGANGGSTVTPSGIFTMTNVGANGTDYSSKINYSLNQGSLSYNPFVAFGFNFYENESNFDLSGSTGISFYHKGNGLHLQTLLSSISDYAHYQVVIPSHSEWTKVTLNWSDFEQPSWGAIVNWDLSRVTGFKWQKNGNTGESGEIYIDEVKIEGLIFETPLKPCESTGVAQLSIVPQNTIVKLNESVELNAMGIDNCGNETPISPIVWSSNVIEKVFTATELGVFNVSATVFNEATNDTITASTTITVVANEAPIVSITSPTSGFYDRNNFLLTAEASDIDGSISKVEFYADNNLLTTVDAAPYTWMWRPQNDGIYAVTAVAYDDNGTSTVSTAIEIELEINELPIVTMTSPTPGTYENNDLTITAEATDPDGSISKVDFYANGTLIGTENSSPYSFSWEPENGTYLIKAVAFDNVQASTVSPSISVIVNKEEVSTCPVWDANTQYQSGDIVEFEGVNYTAISDWGNIGETPRYNIDHNWGWSWQEGGSSENTMQSAPYLVLSSQEELSQILKVYPNPTSGLINISVLVKKGNLYLYNMQGVRVLGKSFTKYFSEQLDLKEYKKGVYLLSVEYDNQMVTQRVLIH